MKSDSRMMNYITNTIAACRLILISLSFPKICKKYGNNLMLKGVNSLFRFLVIDYINKYGDDDREDKSSSEK